MPCANVTMSSFKHWSYNWSNSSSSTAFKVGLELKANRSPNKLHSYWPITENNPKRMRTKWWDINRWNFRDRGSFSRGAERTVSVSYFGQENYFSLEKTSLFRKSPNFLLIPLASETKNCKYWGRDKRKPNVTLFWKQMLCSLKEIMDKSGESMCSAYSLYFCLHLQPLKPLFFFF